MKKFICLLSSCCLYISVIAQPLSLNITTDKTTSLVFPFPIRHVDRGTKDILAQQVKEADNILLVKAYSKGFPETNLSVITEDGSVYTFTVNYLQNPAVWVYNLAPNKKATIASYANAILDNPKIIKGPMDIAWKISTTLMGVYTKENISYFQMKLTNKSSMDYDTDALGFYIRDKKRSRRTAIQENELIPIYIAGNYKKVKAHQRTVFVIAFERFTIPDAKYMAMQMSEKNGGRNLLIKINNKQIVKARALPDLR